MGKRGLLIIGAILLILGLASLFVPIPNRERRGFDAGPVSVGVEVTRREKVNPAVSATLIAGGAWLIAMSAAKKR